MSEAVVMTVAAAMAVGQVLLEAQKEGRRRAGAPPASLDCWHPGSLLCLSTIALGTGAGKGKKAREGGRRR